MLHSTRDDCSVLCAVGDSKRATGLRGDRQAGRQAGGEVIWVTTAHSNVYLLEREDRV